jgi:hypothetical protein
MRAIVALGVVAASVGAAAPAWAGGTERVSLGPRGARVDSLSFEPSVSADGRHIVFVSGDTNLVPGDTNGAGDVFVRVR